jgi:hypothetical protein
MASIDWTPDSPPDYESVPDAVRKWELADEAGPRVHRRACLPGCPSSTHASHEGITFDEELVREFRTGQRTGIGRK